MLKHKKAYCQGRIDYTQRYSVVSRGMAVDLIETSEGVLIRKHTQTCRYCGSIENVHKFKCDEICAACADEIVREVQNKDVE